jgi:hypothetical protein
LTREGQVTAGTTPKQADLWRGTAAVCEGRVGERSIWAVLYHQGDRLFADELFADLFAGVGRRSVPPRIVATVMVLQRLQGCSDREAVEAFNFDARWKYACGGLPFDHPGFSHTVLVDMRARLAASARPERVFEATVQAARQAGLVGVRRVLDSTPLYDAVATMDTLTLLGAAIRGVLKTADPTLAARLRGVLANAQEYASLTKPQIDWDDQAARRRWWMRVPGMPARCLGSWRATCCPRRWPRPSGCWRPWWARTWSKTAMAASESPARSPPTGWSPPSTPTPAMVTRAARGASTATRGTPRSTPTAS